MPNKSLDVYYKGTMVCRLAETPDRLIAFQYDAGWLRSGFSISPFSLPLRPDVFVPDERSRERFGGLFGVFADSLPDSWGELLLDRYLASHGIKEEDIGMLDKLSYIGKSGMGALEYYPSNEADYNMNLAGIDYDTIARECSQLLDSRPSDQLDLIYKLAGSSGGTRPKILLSEDGRDWIVKFPARKDPSISGRREYDYSICAKDCGIKMTETGIIPSNICEGYFKTERFDRNNGDKIFSVTFTGLLEADFRAPSCDYGTFMKLVRVLTKDNISDKEQMYMVMCFNVATHNLDDHTKNFSFTYSENAGWRLAPAYDLTYSETYWGEHTTSVNGKGRDITRDDLVKVGTEAGLTKEFCYTHLNEILEKTKSLDQYLSGSNKDGKHTRLRTSLSEFTRTEVY
ncbi:MAG: type II toxin-antitoxin system HipA family toxin [Lachnospiraceae bacterium]|nr:type II toxin-antitoxin system HipA family toxin [Lachnospiraceae bacterium]